MFIDILLSMIVGVYLFAMLGVLVYIVALLVNVFVDEIGKLI